MEEFGAFLIANGVFDTSAVDIDAVCVLENGHIVLSTENDETLKGVAFTDGDLVEYDPINETASIIFYQSWFDTSSEDIDAVCCEVEGIDPPIPEIASVILMSLGLLGLGSFLLVQRKAVRVLP